MKNIAPFSKAFLLISVSLLVKRVCSVAVIRAENRYGVSSSKSSQKFTIVYIFSKVYTIMVRDTPNLDKSNMMMFVIICIESWKYLKALIT